MKRHRPAAVGPRRLLPLVIGVSLLVAGCGADSDKGAQPRPDVTTFEEGSFDNIPLVAESDPVTPPNEKSGVDSRSYVVRNTTPAEVLEFYEQQLAESTLVSGPEEVGNDTYRGRWELEGGRVLTVSATPGGTFEQGESAQAGELLTQYSLSLAPVEG